MTPRREQRRALSLDVRRAAWGICCTLLLASAFIVWPCTGEAQPQWRPSGALSAGVLFRGGSPGPGVALDLWQPVGMLRIGGSIGVAAISAADEDDTQAFMPLGLSVALRIPVGRGALDIGSRGGIWAGARKEGLRVGPWVSGGLRLNFAIDDAVWLTLGTDIWFLGGESASTVWVPNLGLTWDLGGDDAG